VCGLVRVHNQSASSPLPTTRCTATTTPLLLGIILLRGPDARSKRMACTNIYSVYCSSENPFGTERETSCYVWLHVAIRLQWEPLPSNTQACVCLRTRFLSEEATCSSETSVGSQRRTQCYIPESPCHS
jgi:hypothetical protein